ARRDRAAQDSQVSCCEGGVLGLGRGGSNVLARVVIAELREPLERRCRSETDRRIRDAPDRHDEQLGLEQLRQLDRRLRCFLGGRGNTRCQQTPLFWFPLSSPITQPPPHARRTTRAAS